jgi:hypothetical protein
MRQGIPKTTKELLTVSASKRYQDIRGVEGYVSYVLGFNCEVVRLLRRDAASCKTMTFLFFLA